jgi:SAM-dependent methyltransferase
LPDSLREHWPRIRRNPAGAFPTALKDLESKIFGDHVPSDLDVRTRENFSNEWEYHDVGGDTWGMKLEDRIKWYFLESIGIPFSDLGDKLMLDAGCGNGSQSVGYTKHGLEVIAIDLSSGLEKGYAFRNVYDDAVPEKVHFVQADLQKPPLAVGIFDIIHSAGVLHHTPNTKQTFEALVPLLNANGTFYVWLYKYERIVTPIVNAIRTITTRLPASTFSIVAKTMAVPFIGFCWIVDRLGIRSYKIPDRNEATIAVHDIFGAPYAHYHDLDEVKTWFASAGINDVWPCNDGRRGFGVCGRKTGSEMAAGGMLSASIRQS